VGASVSRALKAPPTAVTWGLVRIFEKGERGKTKVQGEPLPDGTVPDRWAAAEFSASRVLELFGPHKYRVDWYDATGKRITGMTFSVANPPATGARLQKGDRGRPARSRAPREDEDDYEDDDRRRAPAASGEGFSFREYLAMQAELRRDAEAREERNEQRRREEMALQQTRDREFMGMIIGTLQQTRAQPAEASDLMRRELSLQIRQEMHELRTQLGELEPEEEPGEPPADLEEGVSRVGAALLGELEQRAPNLVNELIPAVGDWLKAKGYIPGPDVQAQLAATVARGRNGAGQS
jgi:hypothetical protein